MIAKTTKKAQALIISLWVLIILTVLAISVGHRVSIGLRLSRYSKDRIKAYSLARGGIQRGIIELENDKGANQYDALSETWSTGIDPLSNRPEFENAEIKAGSGETFTLKEFYDEQTPVCISDEEHKININSASAGLLFSFLSELNLEAEDAQGITRYIRIWRGDNEPALEGGEAFFLNFKKKPLVVPEELILILALYYQNKGEQNFQEEAKDAYAYLRYLITTFSGGTETKININTASRSILSVLARSEAAPEKQQSIEALVNHIINFRESDKGPFRSQSDINAFSESELTETEEKNLFNDMKPSLTASSSCFRLSSTGKAGKISKKITAVYNRENKKIVYWHEDL